MEFNEKLQTLRKERGVTQEELAEALFISRTAVSKWESGRGYPNIDSLKALSAFFSVSLDDLICSETAITLAERDKKNALQKNAALTCGALDALILVLLFLPAFGGDASAGTSVPVYALASPPMWEKWVFIAVIGITALNGLCGLCLLHFEKPFWNRHRVVTGLALSVVGSLLFIAARQPYAAALFFVLLVVKAALLFKVR